MLPEKLPRVLRSATHARGGGGSVPLRSAPFRSVPSPFRYALAARVLRSVPRARRHYTRARARCAAARPRPSPLGVPFRECGGTTLALLVAPPPSLHSTHSGERRHRRRPPRANCSALLRKLRGAGVGFPPLHSALRSTPRAPSPLGVPFRESGGITRFARYTAALAPLHAKRGAPPPPPPPRKLLR